MQNQPVQRAAQPAQSMSRYCRQVPGASGSTPMLRMAETSLGLRPASKGDVDVRLAKLDAAALAAAIGVINALEVGNSRGAARWHGHVIGREHARGSGAVEHGGAHGGRRDGRRTREQHRGVDRVARRCGAVGADHPLVVGANRRVTAGRAEKLRVVVWNPCWSP